jgi:hypothetical protein
MADLSTYGREAMAMGFGQQRACHRRRGRLALLIAGLSALFICAFMWLSTGEAQAYKGINEFSTVQSDTQAGGHPDFEIHAKFDNRVIKNGENLPPLPGGCGCDDPEIIDIQFPTGFIGDPHAVPKCTLALFSQQACAPESQVGVLNVGLFGGYTPIYNMEPHQNEAGLLGFNIPIVGAPSFIVLHARTDSDYGLNATNGGIYHLLPISELNIYMWGVPSLPSHDQFRFPIEKQQCLQVNYPDPCYPPVSSNSPPTPFLESPTTCETDLTARLAIHYYDGSDVAAEAPWSKTTGCDQLSFNPSLTAVPTTDEADTAAGMDVELKVPQNQSAFVPSPSQIRETVVTMPEGMSINPSGADGKAACTDTEAAFGTELPAHCPEYSKVGTVELDSSALPGPIRGAIYLGQPLPGDKYRIFLTASGFATNVKLPGSVHTDPATGQMVIAFQDLPQTPFQRFTMHFFGSERGLLATPESCGTYGVRSRFVPWNSFLPAQESVTFFTIASGPNGTPCPGPSRPFKPTLKAGSQDNTAGVFTPFALKLSRDDGDQNMTGVDLSTPKGFLASLAGVPYCPESALTGPGSLSDPNRSGQEELLESACPQASQIGTMVAGAGAGNHPLHTPGRVYLAGPYRGSDLSLVTVTPAVSGPYDLGNVVDRIRVFVDPVTTQITAMSDPISQIMDGIPLRVRTIQIDLNRPKFTLNPTNCDPFSVTATVFGDQGGVANPSQGFQVGNCGALPFAPKLSLKLRGNTKRRGHPALHAVVTRGPGEANLKRIVVTMPSNELLDNAHLDTICTRVQFAAKACPDGSVVGRASVETPLLDQPLSGPVVLRSSSHKLPDLVLDLRGQLNIELVGRIDTAGNGGLRTTFETVPDAPFTRAVVDLEGGKKGLLQNSGNLCKSRKKATIELVGQSDRRSDEEVKLTSSCGKKKKRSHRKHRRKRRGTTYVLHSRKAA